MAIELIGLTIARSLAANSGAAGVYAPNQIYASTAVGRKLQEVTSVRDYGALGDGVTDDTAAIQNAINTLIAGNNGGQLYFPPGTYVISAALTISFATHWRIYGASRGKVTIRQTADNTPIFTLTTALTWGWKIEELTFTWANAQPATNTGAIAIYMSGAASYSGGFYNFQISRCNFSNGYRAISGPSTLQCPLWGVEIYGCCHLGTMTGAFFYAAPSPSVGQPNIHLRNCFIDAGLASEALVTIVAGDTISLSNLEFVNGAASRCGSLMMLSTCMSLTVNSCKSEAFVFDTGSTPYLWNFPNSRVTLINCSIIGFTGTGNPRLIAAGSGGTLSISGIILSSSLTSGNAVAWLATTILFVANATLSGLVTDNIRSVVGNVTGLPNLYFDARTSDYVTAAGDASVTLTYQSDRVQMFSTTLTAARVVTLPGATGMKVGMEFEILRNAATPGAYTLTVTDPLSGVNFVFQPNETGSVRYRYLGGAWVIIDACRTLQKPPRLTGTAAPTVAPDFVGQQFTDTTNKKIYFATGASASTDWTLVN